MPASVMERTDSLRAWIAPTVEPVMVRTTSAKGRTFGAYLIELAEAAGFTQASLARASGVNQTQLSRAYDGDTIPTLATLRKLAPHLGVRLGDLLIAAVPGLTPAELGMVGAPPPPAAPLPPVIRSILSRLASPRYKQKHKDDLLYFIQDDVDRWDGMIERIEEERAEARRGRR